MTNQGPRRSVRDGESEGRLREAREFLESSRDLVMLAQRSSYNGAITLMVSAAIAYADAVTSKQKGVVNKQDHAAAVRLLREAVGSALPKKQATFFAALLKRKDEVNYGARSTSLQEAQRLLIALDEFATWAEGVL